MHRTLRRLLMKRRALTSVAKGLLGALLAFTVQFVMTSTASASCGDYLLHGQSTRGLLDGHTAAERGPIPSLPRSQLPCRGVNCSRGKPLAPVPPPLRLHWDDQWCLFAASVVANETSHEDWCLTDSEGVPCR